MADSLGADDYGMKHYLKVEFLPTAPRIQTEEENRAFEKAQYSYWKGLADQGHLALTGIYFGRNDVFSELLLNTTDRTLADSLMQGDPKVKADLLRYRLWDWYGPAALLGLKPLHNQLVKPQD